MKYFRETDIVYDMTIMMKLAHPRITQFDLNNMITMWRKKFDLTGTCHMHEAASKQAFQAVAKFRKANRLKHHKRVWRKKQARLGKCQTYKHNRWTEPSSLMRRWDKKITRLRSLNSRGRPKLRDNGCVFLPGLGEVKPRTTMPEGRLVSFQMIDVTDKVTRKTADFQRKFRLCLQTEIPDPEPADVGGKIAGLDLGVRHLAAVADSHGNERLYNVPGGCRRHGGDKIDRLRARRSKYKRGSREWGKTGRVIKKELKKTSDMQRHNETGIARRITRGLSALFLEDLDLTRMRRSNGNASKTGLNREMAYSRLGEFRTQVEWQMKKKGGISKRVEHAYTSQMCSSCKTIDKKSRNGESFTCTSCGWYHHADKNAARNFFLNECLHMETGGQAHKNSGGTIAGVEVVTRRKNHGPSRSAKDGLASRLGPDNDDTIAASESSCKQISL